jgi:hypothetical protein
MKLKHIGEYGTFQVGLRMIQYYFRWWGVFPATFTRIGRKILLSHYANLTPLIQHAPRQQSI